MPPARGGYCGRLHVAGSNRGISRGGGRIHQVDHVGGNDPGFLPTQDKLVSDVQDDEQDSADVGSQEIGDVPLRGEEDVKAVQEADDGAEDDAEVSARPAAHRAVGQGATVHALNFEGGSKAKIGQGEYNPREEGGHVDHVDQPVEHLTGTGVDVQIGQKSDRGGARHGPDGDPPSVRFGKDLGRVTGRGQRVDGAGAQEHVDVACGPGGTQDDGIHDVVEDVDAGLFDSGDKGRCSRTGTARGEFGGIGGTRQGDCQDGEDVEDDEADGESFGGLGEGFLGVSGLAAARGHHFGRKGELVRQVSFIE